MNYFLIFIIIFIAYVVEGLTGFGGAVIALPFLSILIGLNDAVTLILVISSLFGIYILLKKRQDVDWKQYIRIITFMALGLPIGILLGQYLPQNVLKTALGLFTLTAGIKGLWFRSVSKKAPMFLMRLCLVGGGILQGAFATGGPLVIVYAKSMIQEKHKFRATLILVWLTLNAILLTERLMTGRIGDIGDAAGAGLIAWAAGILIGSWICRKVNTKQFEKIVYWILFAAGLFMLFQMLFHCLFPADMLH